MNPVDVVRQRERAGTLQSAAFKIAREAEQAAHDAYKLTVYKQQVDFDMAWTRLRDAWQEAKYSRDQQAIELAAEKLREASARPPPSFEQAAAERDARIEANDLRLRDTLAGIRQRLERHELTDD